MLAKKTSKNQLTLPKEIVRDFPGIDYFDIVVRDSAIVMTPVKISPVGASLNDIREKMERLGITEKDVPDAVKWARRKKA